MDRSRLRQLLVDHFSTDDLQTLCFELGIEYDDLPGAGRAGKARELITYLQRRGRLPDLVKMGKQLRPGVPWEDHPTAQAASLDRSQAQVRSLRRQLADEQENLLLIKEQKSKYVMETDIPLQLIKQERATREKIADLKARLAELEPM